MSEIDHTSAWGAFAPTPWRQASLRAAHAVPADWPLAERIVKVLRRPIKYGGQACYDVVVWGWKLRLCPHGNRTEVKLLYAPQLWDAEERRFLAGHLGVGAVFVDIGANAGAYTYWAARCMQGQGRILAFEPDDEMRARLDFNLRQNPAQGVEVESVALSDRKGTADFYIDREQRGRNTLDSAASSEAGREVRKVELDTLLDRLVARRISRIDALKIDIEGHELPVLRHFFAHAPAGLWPRVVLAEYTHDADDSIAALLHAVGYRTVLQTDLNRAYERPETGRGKA